MASTRIWEGGAVRAGLIHRRVIGPIVAVLAIAVVAVAALMWVQATTQDDIARSASIDTFREGLEERVLRLDRTVKDYAYWTEAYQAIHVDRDMAWVDENLRYLMEVHGYEGLFVIGPDGSTVYASYRAERVEQDATQALGTDDWRTLVERGRDTPVADPQPHHAFLALPGTIAIASVTAITPEEGWAGAPVPQDGRFVLLVVQKLDAEMLRELADAMRATNVRFETAAAAPAPGEASLVLRGVDGAPVGSLVWMAHRPGREYLSALLPGMAMTLALFSGFGWVAFRQARNATQAVVLSEGRFRDVAEASSDWIVETDADGSISWISNRFTALTQIAADDVYGRPLQELLLPAEGEVGGELDQALHDGRPFRDVAACCLDRDGKRRVLRCSGLPVRDESGALLGWRAVATDVTVEIEAKAVAQYLDGHDQLTGLLNRKALVERLDAVLAVESRRQAATAVLQLDINAFREVNQTFGPATGDAILQALAERLNDALRPGDLLARLGGDEFVVVHPGLADRAEAGQLALALQQLVAQPFPEPLADVPVQCSVAVVVAPDDADQAERALQMAGLVMARAKADGRGSIRTFEPGMDAALQRRKQLERDLRIAVAERQFELHYQPKLDLRTNRMCGVEALLRWRHPERGMVPPMEFIPIAEENGLIRPIGDWALSRACHDAAQWGNITVAVNLSPEQLKDDAILKVVQHALRSSGLPAHRLELEITEGVLLADDARSNHYLDALAGMGVRLAMDDFGTGYASMSYLTKFHFDKIKIDRAFVQALERTGEPIIRAVTGMARAMGARTCAEGVETQAQIDALRRLGCDEVQGYYYARPMPKAEFVDRFSLQARSRIRVREGAA